MFGLDTFTVLWIAWMVFIVLVSLVARELGIKNEYKPFDKKEEHYPGNLSCLCLTCDMDSD